MHFSAIPRLLQAGGFCYCAAMKTIGLTCKTTGLLAMLLPALWGGPAAAGYEDALLMVRNQEFGKAMSEFKLLAETGHAASQFSIGLMYHLGRGVERDEKTAYEWYKKAVLQRYAPAMNNMGMMYLNGEYVVKNEDVAFRLFEEASTDHVQALDNLGRCFENGWGVQQDIGQAINFYQLAGDAGYMLGYFHIGQVYEKGYPPDTPKDIDKAVSWYVQAAEKKFNRAKDRLRALGRLPEHLK